MNNLRVLGKFLDQPILVAKFQKKVPYIVAGSVLGYSTYKTAKAPEGQKKDTAIKTGITLGAAGFSAVAAPKIASKITKRALPDSLEKIKEKTKNLSDEFIKNNTIDNKTKEIIEKGKDKILNFKQIKSLFLNLKDNKNGKNFLNQLIPEPQNVSAKDIFSEIGYLSILGAVPVLGGITGGIAADKITEKDNWKNKIPDKIKEGAYQYLANIFLCNIGAGMALGMLEKANIHSKSARAAGMTLGIITTGIIGGSKIANFIGRKIIDPVCDKATKNKKETEEFTNKEKALKYMNKEIHHKDRTPEMIDIGLHTDDIATVSMLSGLKWIEPALPLLYSVSGYRAGIGYRN